MTVKRGVQIAPFQYYTMFEINTESIKSLCRALPIGEPLATLLVKRGYDTVEKAKEFLYPTAENAEDAFVLSGMDKAVERIRAALDAGEKIVVYGDYDCDGIMATSILYDYLRSLGADVSYYIPNRFDAGYGLSIETLEEIAETEFPDLLITVDCGISSVEEAAYLDEVLAIDLIVTDHHNLPDEIPNTIVVNPKQDPNTKSVNLCGAGVAFKVVQALGGWSAAWKYIELAAIATVADVVPLTGENRLITALGLQKINSREKINKGLRLLIESAGLEKVDSGDIGFRIGPRINAVGRLGDSSEVVSLFTTEEFVVLEGLTEKLTRMNDLRKSVVEQIYQEAIEMLKDYDLSVHRILFLYKEDWNPGVLGLVAGRLKNEFSRPVVLVTGEDKLRGSARSVEGVDIHATLKSAKDHLITFGGHKGAAGLSLLRENLIAARNQMDAFLEENYPVEAFTRDDSYDLALSPQEITLRLADEITLLEPTGEGNRKPIFKFTSDKLNFLSFANGQHIKCKINEQAEMVGFQMAYVAEGIAAGGKYDFLCECNKDIYKNRERVQMRITGAFMRSLEQSAQSVFLFNRYLRSNLFKEEKCDLTAVEQGALGDLLYDDRFCTLFLSLSENSALRFPLKESVPYVEYGRALDAPWNEVLIAPEKDPVGYRRIVLLDTPLTTGYAAKLFKATGAEIYIVKDNYPYTDLFRKMDLSVDALSNTYQTLRRFVYSGNGAASPVELMGKVAPSDPYTFLTHFYILYQSGSISVGQGFVITLRPFVDPAESLLYRRLSALKKRL